ncbi:MAG: TolC family protein [Alphaproteobacteria bacterium]|nr:TolC family protein [Alphaproteobacteria bacterium]
MDGFVERPGLIMFVNHVRKLHFLIVALSLIGFASTPLTARANDSFDPLRTHTAGNATPLPTQCPQTIDPAKSYTLNDIIALALCHNPKTQHSWERFLASQARLGSARGAYLPTIEGELNYGNNRGSATGSTTSTKPKETLTDALTLDYLLFDFGQREASVQRTKQTLLAANYTHNTTLQSVIFDTLKSYYDFYGATAELDAAKESEESSKVSFDAASFREQIGAAPMVEKLKAETAYSQAKLTRIQAENTLAKSKGALLTNIGFDSNQTIQLADPAMNEPTPETSKHSIDEMITHAKTAHPSLLAAQANVDKSKSDLALARRGLLPSISLNSSIGESHGLSNATFDHSTSTIGIQMSIPLFSGFSKIYDINAARHDLAAAKAQQQQTAQSISQDIWNAYQDLDTINQNLVTTSDLLTSATEAEKVALARYKSGAGSLIDLLDAQAQLASARQQRVASTYNWYVSKANLLRAMGSLDSFKQRD